MSFVKGISDSSVVGFLKTRALLCLNYLGPVNYVFTAVYFECLFEGMLKVLTNYRKVSQDGLTCPKSCCDYKSCRKMCWNNSLFCFSHQFPNTQQLKLFTVPFCVFRNPFMDFTLNNNQ